MLPLLAQLESVPSGFIKNAALTFMAGLGCWYFINEIIESRKEKKQQSVITPQPLIVAHADIYANRSEVQELKREADQKFQQVEDQRQTDLEAANTGRRLIYDKIDDVRLELSDKIDDMPGKIIDILKKTGAIK